MARPRHGGAYRLLNEQGDGVGVEEFFNELRPGRYVALYYDDDPGIWHEALLTGAGRADPRPWCIFTPDDDLYVTNLLPRNGEDGPQRVALLPTAPERRRCPDGSFYKFRKYPDSDVLRTLLRDGRHEVLQAKFVPQDYSRYVDVDGQLRELPEEGVPPPPRVRLRSKASPSAVQGAPGAGSGDQDNQAGTPPAAPKDGLEAPEGKAWVVLDDVGDVARRGDEVKLTEGDPIRGPWALHTYHNGEVVAARLMTSSEADRLRTAGAERADGADSRLLGDLTYDASGVRYRDFSNGVKNMRQEDIDDFPLAGERTAAWLFRYILDHGGTPDGRHTKWMQEQGIQKESGAAHLHDLLGLAMQLFVTFDQVDPANLAGVEVLARAYQLVEETSGLMKIEGLEHYIGRERGGATRRGIALAPGMARYATDQLARETEIAKQRRKAREERAAKKSP